MDEFIRQIKGWNRKNVIYRMLIIGVLFGIEFILAFSVNDAFLLRERKMKLV